MTLLHKLWFANPIEFQTDYIAEHSSESQGIVLSFVIFGQLKKLERKTC